MPPPKPPLDFDTVRTLARGLADIEAIPGTPSLKARGKLLAWIPPHKSVEPGSLAVRLDADRRAELLETAPEIYYITDHYLNYPTVLVRLARIPPDALKDLLRLAWSQVTAKPPRPKRPTKRK
jgi:hypothetical protein